MRNAAHRWAKISTRKVVMQHGASDFDAPSLWRVPSAANVAAMALARRCPVVNRAVRGLFGPDQGQKARLKLPYMFTRPATGAPLNLREIPLQGADWCEKFGHVVLGDSQAAHLNDLRTRVQRGWLRGDTAPAPECSEKHGEFIRWLIAHGKISEGSNT